jgi:hypothetical protein
MACARPSHAAHGDIEPIEVVYEPIKSAERLIVDESIAKPAALLFALNWFYKHHASKWL